MDRCQSIAWFCLPLLFALVGGCQPSGPAGSTRGDPTAATSTAANDGVPADQILTHLKAVYANATSYSDSGTLLLSYRKDGLLTEEPQRWSTAWSADGKLAMEVFGAHIKGDGRRLSCYVYDIETENLDGQRMLVPYQTAAAPPVEKIFRDPIGQIFLGGYSDLPLNEVDKSLQEKLIPAPMSLLTGKLPCGWLQNPSGIERLPDETLGQQACYVIRALADGLGCDIWIDKSTGLLAQMSLPLKLLDPQVMAAPNITDLKLLARFENAKVNQSIDPKTFDLRVRKNSTPVRSFVTLPEALPVESIGQVLNRFRLVQPDSKPVTHLHFDGKPTALIWLGAENSYTAIKRVNELANELPPGRFNFGIVYSDSELVGAQSEPHLVRPELTAAMASSDIPMYYDPNLAASTALAIRDIPSVVLLDGDSRVQFAASVVGDEWADELAVAIQRVAAGDNLAEEMLGQYQQFMTRYKTALKQVDASALMPSNLLSNSSLPGDPGKATNSDTIPIRSSAPAFTARKTWISRDFKQPGNISVTFGRRAKISVLDGLRTITELDAKGTTVSSRELDLPEGTGVSRIRSTIDGRQQVLFSPFSNRVFVFDASWQPTPINSKIANHVNSPVSDAFVAEDQRDGALLVIATQGKGTVSMSLDGSNPFATPVKDLAADSIVLSDSTAIFVENGILKTRHFTEASKATRFESSHRFNRISWLSYLNQEAVIGTAFDGSQWNAVCTDLGFNKTWESPIGSQLFESLIEPIAPLRSRNETRSQQARSAAMFAVSTTRNTVHIFDAQDGWLADVRLDNTPTGVALAEIDREICLLVSVGSRVECWTIRRAARE